MNDFTQLQWLKYAVFHPIDSFAEIRYRKKGSLKVSAVIISLLFLGEIVSERFSGEQFGAVYEQVFNIVPYIIRSIGLVAVWVTSCRAVSTFLDGEGSFRGIFIYTSYAIVPFVAELFITTALSRILTADEVIFIQLVRIIGVCWSAMMIFSAVRTANNYTFGRTVFSIILSLFAMTVIFCLIILMLSLFQQVLIFVYSLYTEISYRIRIG